MSETPLPLDRFSPEAHLTVIEDLVERYVQVEEPVHYKKAAINLSETTTSSCLRFFSDIGLIEAEKAGVYTPSKPVVNYFRKVGDSKNRAQKEIKEILDEYDLFSEALFLAKTGEFDLEELSIKVAGQLDIDKDNVSNISKAIGIFVRLGFFELNDSDDISVVRPITQDDGADSDENTDENSGSNSVQQSQTATFDSVDADEIEFPPSGGKPKGLLDLVDELSGGGSYSSDTLSENLEISKRQIQRLTRYGISLGFIRQEDGGYQLSESGYELAFASDKTEREKLFQTTLCQYPSYKYILQSSLDELGADSDSLESTIIEKELRTTFGFTGESESKVRKAISTLLRTVEAAGFGEYVAGTGSTSTRIEASANDLNSLRSVIFTRQGQSSAEESEVDASSSGREVVTEATSSENGDLEHDIEQVQETNVDSTSTEDQGPAIRISEFRVQNFRNIRDTGFIELENVTTLIGKNESGKTSTLEAINSFSPDYEYTERDLSNSFGITNTDERVPIISLRFELSESLVNEFYPQLTEWTDTPLTVTRTKYRDGSYESETDASIDVDEVELPTPKLLYYDSYNLINDSATIDQLKNGERGTFQNLLNLGGISVDDFDGSPLRLSNIIEHAQNRIEDQLNKAWSQKSLNINLRWMDSEQEIHLLIQDQLNPDSAVDERPLTYPSQRSEGFQWFLSFYINLLAESSSSGLESKVLLLDDPAVYLHPEGKRDWLESVNEIGKNEQVVFSSHSPYLIDKRYPSRIRAVEDTPGRGTKIREDIFESDSRTLEPLRNALGVNLGSSPFISRRQLLVEGPTEYYVVAAVANYFTQVLDRDLFGWPEVSIMPARGASNVVGQASWLQSEGISYAIMLDSDEAGQETLERIRNHHPDIDADRVVLLQSTSKSEDVVTEDLFDPELYVSEFNAEYEEFTSELDGEFEPASVEGDEGLNWEIGGIEYDGSRLDEVLVEYLENSNISEGLQNSRGNIELRKRQIAERISSRLNRNEVDESQLRSFNRLFAEINSAIEVDD